MLKKIAVNIARIVLAVTLILSGFVKAVDPMGTQYKIADYLTAMHLGGIVPDFVALGAAVLLSAFEFWLGICLLFAIQRRVVSVLTLLMMAVMTPLTLWLAVANPIVDCGCFGDAVVLTNWQTFGKNVLLLAAALTVWKWPLEMIRFISRSNQWIVINYSAVFILVVSGWSLYDEPPFDFRPYHVGTDLNKGWQQMMAGEESPYADFFVEQLPPLASDDDEIADDTAPDTASDTAPDTAADSVAVQDAPADITEELLTHRGYTFLLVAPYLEKADDSQLDLINEVYEYADDNGYPFYCLTASGMNQIRNWCDMTGAEYPFCQTDGTTLKTVMRSNPGLMLLKDGVIIRKWSRNRLPDEYVLSDRLERLETGQMPDDSIPGKILTIFTWYVLPLLLLTLADRLWAWTERVRRIKKAIP